MFKKMLWIIGIILIILALLGVSYYIAKSSGFLAVADPSIKCQDTVCCKNAGYEYFDTSSSLPISQAVVAKVCLKSCNLV